MWRGMSMTIRCTSCGRTRGGCITHASASMSEARNDRSVQLIDIDNFRRLRQLNRFSPTQRGRHDIRARKLVCSATSEMFSVCWLQDFRPFKRRTSQCVSCVVIFKWLSNTHVIAHGPASYWYKILHNLSRLPCLCYLPSLFIYSTLDLFFHCSFVFCK